MKYDIRKISPLGDDYIMVRLMGETDMSFLEGKILTLIEGFGMSATQESAGKSFVKEILWSWFYDKPVRKKKIGVPANDIIPEELVEIE